MSVSELNSKYFQTSQLPHSLGGSYMPGSGSQRPPQITKSPPSRQQQQHHNGEPSTAAGINPRVRAFQGGPMTTMGGGGAGGSGPGPARPPPPSPHTKPKPVPPTKSSKPSPFKSRSRENSNTSQPPAVLKKPHGNGDVSQRSEGSKPRVPMLPRTKPTASPSQQNKPAPVTSFPNRLGSPTRSGGIKGHSVGESSGGGGGIASRIRNLQMRSTSEDWHGSTREVSLSSWGGHTGDERTRSGSAGSQSSSSPNHSNQASPNRTKKPLIPVRLLPSEEQRERERERDREREQREKERERKNTTNDGHTSRQTVAMAKGSPRVPPPHTPHNPHTHAQQQHIHNVSPYASLSIATASTNHNADVIDGGEYENVDIQPIPDGCGHQQAPPHHPTSYENVAIKPSPRARHGPAHQRAHPHQHQPSKPAHRQSSFESYENVDFSPVPPQSSQRPGPAPSTPAPVPHPSPSEEHVMDDDDTLFGKEGPPGMKREEVIYENFGPDAGNKHMTVDEMERHVTKKDKKGLSAEYLKIKNEPLCGNYKACRYVSHVTLVM